MKILRSSLVLAGCLLAAALQPQVVSAQILVTQSVSFTGLSLAIPDNDPSGLVRTFTPTFTGIDSISNVTLTLNISGTWNGDLYGYLVHDTGFAVLLNRAGRSTTNAYGYSDAGFDMTFDDQNLLANDIHTYHVSLGNPGRLVSPLTGTWLTDGRNTDPFNVTGAETRDATLDSFIGLDPNRGNWTLFLADLSAGDESVLTSWGLTVIGVPVPEPGTALWLMGGALGAFLYYRRRKS